MLRMGSRAQANNLIVKFKQLKKHQRAASCKTSVQIPLREKKTHALPRAPAGWLRTSGPSAPRTWTRCSRAWWRSSSASRCEPAFPPTRPNNLKSHSPNPLLRPISSPPSLSPPLLPPPQDDDENHGIAHNYCLYHTRHHSFPDTDPYKVNDALDALRERLGIHAQLEKQEALDTLLGKGRGAFEYIAAQRNASPPSHSYCTLRSNTTYRTVR